MRLPLRSSRLTLRRVRPRDATAIVSAINFPDIARLTLSIPYPYRLSYARSWIQRTRREEQRKDGGHLRLLIWKDDELIGSISADRDGDQAEIGYWLTPPARRQGYMSEAVHLVMAYVFSQWRVERIIARTFRFNQGSQVLLRRNGFRRSAVEVGAVEKNGRRLDVIVWTYDRPKRVERERAS